MRRRLKARLRNASQSLAAVPAVVVALFAALGVALVELDGTLDLEGFSLAFQGDEDAARTVLSVIAGSLITVAGLTFSMTIVVLQLASTQFSPRILRTFFGDRITQITIGTFVGIFVYAILVLRAVGSFGDEGAFVPRLSVTVASALGIGAVVLLIVFLHHVSQLIQASHVMGAIGHDTLTRIDRLYPERYGEPAEVDADELLARWRASPPGRVAPAEPGFVQSVALDELAEDLGPHVERLALLVRPGDFVSVDMALAEVWPPEAADGCRTALLNAVAMARERDAAQDAAFGLRQLVDTAVRAMSPGINDPTTAVTCVGYVRSILARLATRTFPSAVRRFPDRGLTIIAARRDFAAHLDALAEIGRHARGEPRLTVELLAALDAIAGAAADCGARDRAADARAMAATIAAGPARPSVSGA